MSLCSHLLKHFVIAKCCGVPWGKTTLSRDARGKPVYRDPAPGTPPVSFNVSHQAGIVALAAVSGYDGQVDVGTDVVCTSERRARDHRMIEDEGWVSFVDMHADVFAPSEANYLKYQILSAVPGLTPGSSRGEVIDVKLRCFYTLWCLREAYVKMTGDALLAEWLRVLEFRDFRPPRAAPSFEASCAGGSEEFGVTSHDICFRGKAVDDAHVSLRSLGPDYMTCTALRTPSRREDGLALKLGQWQLLSIDGILDFAESQT